MSCLLVLCGHTAAQTDQSIKHNVTFASQVIPKSKFTKRNLAEVGKAEALKHPGLLDIWFTTSINDERELLTEIGTAAGRPYGVWRRRYETLASHKWDVARLLAWDGSAVLDIRDERNEISHQVLFGTDILNISENGAEVKIVDVIGGARQDLAIQVTTHTPFDLKAVVKIWDRFNRLDVGQIDIDLRSDPWFIENIQARIFHPFEVYGRVPTEEEANSLPHLFCVGSPRETPRCTCWRGDYIQTTLEPCTHQ
jgi:hypothetical protein